MGSSEARPELAQLLDLAPHPEGGWFRRTYTSGVPVETPNGTRPTATAIVYLLAAGEESRWHQVSSDELWVHQSGGSLTLRLGGDGDAPRDEVTTAILGADLRAGEQPQVLVPAGTWQAAGPAATDVVCSCVVSPGFDFADWRVLDQPLPRS